MSTHLTVVIVWFRTGYGKRTRMEGVGPILGFHNGR